MPPSNCQKARVHIDLLDENDHDPVFEVSVKRFWIEEDTNDGDILATVKADDLDQVRFSMFSFVNGNS